MNIAEKYSLLDDDELEPQKFLKVRPRGFQMVHLNFLVAFFLEAFSDPLWKEFPYLYCFLDVFIDIVHL